MKTCKDTTGQWPYAFLFVCNEWVHKAAMTYVHTPPAQPCSQIKS